MENERRNSVVIYENWHKYLRELSPEQYVEGMDLIMAYALDGTPPRTEDKELFGFLFGISPIIDSNNKRYKAAKRGGRPRKVKAGEGEFNENV